MVCPSFDQLTPKEKTEYIGALVHSVQSNDNFFWVGKEIIEQATSLGLFEGVKILHNNPEEV